MVRGASAGVLSAMVLALPAHARPDDPLATCRALARHAVSAAQDASTLRAASGRRDGLLAPLVRLAQPRPEVPALPGLHDRAAKLFEDAGPNVVVQLEQTGPVWRAAVFEGTLECATDHFFRFDQDDHLIPMADPAAYDDLCWTSGRDLGTVAGRPALVEIDHRVSPYSGMDVEITPWDDGWGPTCRVSLRYADAFRVSERFCQGEPACGDAERLAPRLAEAYARHPKGETLAAVSPVPASTAAGEAHRLAKVEDMTFGALPTFGAAPRTAYPEYSAAHATLVRLDDRPFIARVGQGGIGWRDIGDYLITYYSPDDDGLKPVASYVVTRDIVGLRRAEVSAPKPFVNTR